jgi:hypothetical protein
VILPNPATDLEPYPPADRAVEWADDPGDPEDPDDPEDRGGGDGDGRDEDDADEAPPNEREKTAERAFRGAVFGFLFWPVFLWAAILVLRAFLSREPWRPRYRRRARWAALFVATPWLLLLAFSALDRLSPRAAPALEVPAAAGATTRPRYRA